MLGDELGERQSQMDFFQKRAQQNKELYGAINSPHLINLAAAREDNLNPGLISQLNLEPSLNFGSAGRDVHHHSQLATSGSNHHGNPSSHLPSRDNQFKTPYKEPRLVHYPTGDINEKRRDLADIDSNNKHLI
jgi:hypothetical protein